MNNGNFSKIKWVVLCICLLAGGFFLLKNLNIQSVDQYDKKATGSPAGFRSKKQQPAAV